MFESHVVKLCRQSQSIHGPEQPTTNATYRNKRTKMEFRKLDFHDNAFAHSRKMINLTNSFNNVRQNE